MSASDDGEYTERSTTRRRKRRRTTNPRGRSYVESPEPSFSSLLAPVLDVLAERYGTAEGRERYDNGFEQFMDDLLPELTQAEAALLDRLKEVDESGQLVRPLTRSQASELLQKLTSTSSADNQLSALSALVSRKLKLQSGDLRRRLLDVSSSRTHSGPTSPLAARTSSSANPQVIDALYSIQTTPYERSFLSRVQGFQPKRTHGVIAVDWETRSPWMELMSDVRQHFALAHPEREQLVETIAPIEYVTLQASHIDQVHDLLGRVFWAGIDVSDSLQYTPEKCTIVATYKQLVVGAAFLSSPQETYITYLAVRAGWENSQIATYVVPCVVYSII
ncbi:hypothetical protein SCP_0904180 [Sparassis crispa]|uniref:Uncharacterized protein n=1 Tax=Sparassis crispa TaxID=139825 RepID=A0A401GWJ0_9APHY|nr:hypothetical protein SCP_0904180 [Sparassis crispa]GBE86539.1 hypothetical protein SCP_0904180 [Sparassis crispa]